MLRKLIPEELIYGSFLEQVFLSNRLVDYLAFVLIFILATIALKLIRRGLLAFSQKFADNAKSELPNFIITKLKKLLVPIEYFGVFYFSVKILVLHPFIIKSLDVIGLLIVTFYAVRFAVAIVDFAIEKKLADSASQGRVLVLRSIMPAINIAIWGIGVVFILSNLGFNISALVAGLGIGGIAVALAAQSMLGDIFSYVSILADKPFEIGDLLVIDGIAGEVNYIGIKTTRLTSVTGEQLVFANSDLTSSRIRNYQKVERRRGEIMIGVLYETPAEKIPEISKMIFRIIEETDGASCARSHFQSYGDFSLNFQAIFWIEGSDYVNFMDKQQEILLKIFNEFKANGIEFAYPTQKLYLSKEK